MPVFILLLIAIAPILTMVASAGDALGRDTHTTALVALVATLSTVVAWLVKEGLRTATETMRRVMSRPYG